MKQRPILMSAPMVRAVLSGQKTQTRRIVKPQPPDWCNNFGYTAFTPTQHISGRGNYEDQGPAEKFFKCPYGNVGDQLWVRESFSAMKIGDDICTWYRADEKQKSPLIKWVPSIHMPRAASRITIEIEAINIERLQNISKADVMAEGCVDREGEPLEDVHAGWHEPYAQLWDKINGEGAWALNPWVWVITFQRIKP